MLARTFSFRSRGSQGNNNGSLSIEQLEAEFNREYEQLLKIHQSKENHFKTIIATKANAKSINNLVQVSDVLKKKISSSTCMQDLQAYYQASQKEREEKNFSVPVFDCGALEQIFQTPSSPEERKEALVSFYTRRFSVLTPTRIIEDGYLFNQRNDLATALTEAMPKDCAYRRMFDQYCQLGKSLRAVKARVEKAKKQGNLDEDFISGQRSDLKRVGPQIHFLGTPEDESASRLTVHLEQAFKVLIADGHIKDAVEISDDIRALADNASTFRKQAEFLDHLAHKTQNRNDFDQDLKFSIDAILKEAKKRVHLPSNEIDLKALDLISELLTTLRKYYIEKQDKEPDSKLRQAARSLRGDDRQSKLTQVSDLINRLETLSAELRQGSRHGEFLLESNLDVPKKLDLANNIQQVLNYAKQTIHSSDLPATLIGIYTQFINTKTVVASPAYAITGTLNLKLEPIVPPPAPAVFETMDNAVLWELPVSAFDSNNLTSTLTKIVMQYGNYLDGHLADEVIKGISKKIPETFYQSIQEIGANNHDAVTVGEALSRLSESSIYYSSYTLLLNQTPSEDDNKFKDALIHMQNRALYKQYTLLIDKARIFAESLKASDNVKSVAVGFCYDLLSDMVGYSQRNFHGDRDEPISDAILLLEGDLLDTRERSDEILEQLEVDGAHTPLPDLVRLNGRKEFWANLYKTAPQASAHNKISNRSI